MCNKSIMFRDVDTKRHESRKIILKIKFKVMMPKVNLGIRKTTSIQVDEHNIFATFDHIHNHNY